MLSIQEITNRDGIGPNAQNIRNSGSKIITGRIPREVRRELMTAVKIRKLGRLKKNGLLPEIFFHPDALHEAKDRQKSEACYGIEQIKKVCC